MQNPFLRRKRRRRYAANVTILILAMFAAVIVAIISSEAGAQTPVYDPPGAPVCVFRPWTVANRHPLGRQIIVQGRAYGYLRPVDAVRYVGDLYGSDNPFQRQETYSAAIQYSIAGSPVLGQMRVAAWLDGQDAPNITLGTAVRGFLMSGNPQQRDYYAGILLRVLRSAQNDSCNPGDPSTEARTL